MKAVFWMVILGAAACSKSDGQEGGLAVSIDDYHGFSAKAAWTYRDDGEVETAPAEGVLLRARYTGDGVLDFRRGVRWADASPAARVRFFLDQQFSIVDWTLGPISGEAGLPLANEEVHDGDEVSAKGWSCITNRYGEVETYYGIFGDVLSFECEGEGGPEGDWYFAKDVGLVAYDGPEYQLSLVAPW
jgi:hypothetical protein